MFSSKDNHCPAQLRADRSHQLSGVGPRVGEHATHADQLCFGRDPFDDLVVRRAVDVEASTGELGVVILVDPLSDCVDDVDRAAGLDQRRRHVGGPNGGDRNLDGSSCRVNARRMDDGSVRNFHVGSPGPPPFTTVRFW